MSARVQSTPRRRISGGDPDSPRNAKRWKRVSDDDGEYSAALCLVSLARCGGAAATTNTVRRAYECGVCGKTFPSYQALGGHKSSHRSKPPTPAAAASVVSLSVASETGPVLRLYKCTTCHKIFPTGQALGGHKRKHYEGGGVVVGSNGGANCSEDGSGASGVTSTGGGDDVMAPMFRNFDLNLPQPPELDLLLNFIM